MTILSLIFATSMTASAGAEAVTSAIASSRSELNHSRALAAAMSGLFWWSAERTSIGLPSTSPPKSSTAIRAAATLPGPVMSAKGPDMSMIKPSLTTSSEIAPTGAWEKAEPACRPAIVPRTIPRIARIRVFMALPPFRFLSAVSEAGCGNAIFSDSARSRRREDVFSSSTTAWKSNRRSLVASTKLS